MTLQPHPPHLPDTAPHWALGEAVIHRVDEVILPPETGSWLLPSATPEVVARAPWLQPSFADPSGTLHLAVHTFAVLINGLRILVDAGVGNGKSRSNPAWDHLDTPYLDRLVAAGFPPDSVDLVILTHLHTDHVGWNTRRTEDGAWRPTFPHARYLTARAEYDYWSGVEMDDWSGVEMDDARRQMFADSVRPVHDSGQPDFVDVPADGTDIAPGVRLLPTPGHTPGQVAVLLSSTGKSAVVTGDCVHHPVQLVHPGVHSSADIDPDQAARTRQSFLTGLADTDVLLLGSHFPPPTAGLLRTDGDGYRLLPVPGRVAPPAQPQ